MILRKFFLDDDPEVEVGTRRVGLRLVKLAPHRRHHFSPEKVAELKDQGFCSITDTTLTLHTVDGDMPFNIDHTPGVYCCHCGDELPATEGACRAHVAEKHEGIESPDASHTAGYKVKLYYGLTPHDSVPDVNPRGLD